MRKLFDSLNNFYEKKPTLSLIIFSLLSGFLTVLFGSQVSSILYPLLSSDPYVNDAGMFVMMGQSFLEGKVPYVEVFDHKGLYLFYYIALGLIGGKVTLFLLQVITFSIFYYFFAKTIVLISEKKSHVLYLTITAIAIFTISHQCPSDMEIIFPFLIVSIYYYLKAIKTNEDKYFYFAHIFVGLTAGLALNIRASDAMVSLAMVIFFVILMIRRKKYLFILWNALVCLAALVLISLPPLIHSLVGGFTSLMYETIILSNFTYIGSTNGLGVYKIISISLDVVLFGTLIALCLLYRKKLKEEIFLFYLVSFIFLFIVQVSIAYYPHYLLICVPLILVFSTHIMDVMNVNKIVQLVTKISISSLMIASFIFFPTYFYTNEYETNIEINKYINEVIPEEDKNGYVLCNNTSSAFYINNNIKISYPDFACQSNHISLSKLYTLDKMIEYAESDKCHFIILDNIDQSENKFFSYLSTSSKFLLVESSSKGSQYILIYKKN